MKIRWYGQSAFALEGDGNGTKQRVAIDPFGPMDGLAARGLAFDYPPIEGLEADLLLVTHEHGDHNYVDAVGGSPVVLRATAGTHESPVGEVVGVASEHDGVAGTQRGANTIFVFTLDGLRVAHFGDFGQTALRPEQIAAIGEVDVALVPVGGGPTVGGEAAAQVVRDVNAKIVVPHHYRTEAVNFLDPPDEFLEALGAPVERVEGSEIEIGDAPAETKVVLLAAPTW
jgi:L-ascorbate metabolism protein UlaG (beta-lactamase superfamily)